MDLIDRFLGAASPVEALRIWLGDQDLAALIDNPRDLARRLNRDVALLDGVLSEQVNAILHHKTFQRLEATWRSLSYLADCAEGIETAKIKTLNVSWADLARDIARAMEFDQSQLFRKVYSEEFGMPGGEPISILIGDYEVQHRPSKNHPTDDIDVLQGVAQVAAAAFAPFIAGASPAMFGLDLFGDLEQPLNLRSIFAQPEYGRWRSFRGNEDSRFIGLTVPRIILRRPYADDGSREDGFRFQEETDGDGPEGYLWGRGSIAFAAVVIRAFGESGWLADIRGVETDRLGGGVVENLPIPSYQSDAPGVVLKYGTEVEITDQLSRDLDEFGFLPLTHCRDTAYAAFYGSSSVQRPKVYDSTIATQNARLSATMQHVLCTSRFSHYLKVMTRDKTGSIISPQEVEIYLNSWLLQYCSADDDATPEMKARYPLREASVQVREREGKPGEYLCTIHLRPHFQFDQIVSSIKLVTQLSAGRPQ